MTPLLTPTMPSISVWMPVSSNTSLTTASSTVSSFLTKPAGSDHCPFNPPYLLFTTSHSPLSDITRPETASQTFLHRSTKTHFPYIHYLVKMMPKIISLIKLCHPHYIPHKKIAYSAMTHSSLDGMPMKKPFRDNPQMAIIDLSKKLKDVEFTFFSNK